MTYSSEVLADSPRVYWRLGETSGTTATDASGGGRHGTIAGSPTMGTTGLVGDSDTAFTFDGVDDKVSVADTQDLTALTVEAWIKKSSAPAATQYVASRDAAGGGLLFWLGVTSTGVPSFLVRNSFPTSVQVSGPASVCDGATHYLAATWINSTGTLTLYVDGAQVATAGGLGGSITDDGPFFVGSGRTSNFFAGVIDEAAYYTTRLTSTRINAHYTAGTPAAPVNGSLAGVISGPTAALSGTATAPTITGTFAGVLDVPTANLSANLPTAGILSGVLDVPTASLTGYALAPGEVIGTFAGVLAAPVANLTGFGTVVGTVDWVIGDEPVTGTGTLLDLSRAVVTNGEYTTDETLAPDVDSMSFYFPGVTLDPAKVYTFAVALESLGNAALTVTVGGVTYYDSATDANVDRANAGDLVQAVFTVGPDVSGSPVFAVTDAVVWSVQWDGGVDPDADVDTDTDPAFGALTDVAVLHIVAPRVPELVGGVPA